MQAKRAGRAKHQANTLAQEGERRRREPQRPPRLARWLCRRRRRRLKKTVFWLNLASKSGNVCPAWNTYLECTRWIMTIASVHWVENDHDMWEKRRYIGDPANQSIEWHRSTVYLLHTWNPYALANWALIRPRFHPNLPALQGTIFHFEQLLARTLKPGTVSGDSHWLYPSATMLDGCSGGSSGAGTCPMSNPSFQSRLCFVSSSSYHPRAFCSVRCVAT